MIDKKIRYRINITVRAEDGYDKPKVGSLLEANECVFSVIISNKKWIVLECIVKGKVDYIDSIRRLKEGEDINLIDWAPAIKNIEMSTYTFNAYKGKLIHLLNWEQTISSPL